MTPLQFEAAHAGEWSELETALAALAGAKKKKADPTAAPALDRARFAALYRLACEHLAVAEGRAYPVWLIERLEAVTARAHQHIYRQADLGGASLARYFLVDFPAAVRAHKWHVLIAFLAFAGPTFVLGLLCYLDPTLILAVFDVDTVNSFDRMYGDHDGPIGRRTASSDWLMFGFYIRNNIGIAFQCFASGLFFGIGSLVFLTLNGVYAGSVAGYLTWHGYGENFYSFVITHGAFELTGIVLAGTAGLVLGEALLFPRRLTRVQALKQAAGRAMTLMYGTTMLFLIAAGFEAFWSAARWIEPPVKYGVGAACWLAVIAYLSLQGRPRRAPAGSK